MSILRAFTGILFLGFSLQAAYAQKADTTQAISGFSGSVGLTNNGFSIVPTFSLHSPAAIINLSWQTKRFSFDPDIRLVPDLSKGSMLFWFRYRIIEQKKFSLRLGVHPAFTFLKTDINQSGKTITITEVLRATAGEVAPNYQISPNWSIGSVYLYGRALQKRGPQNVHVLFLNTSVSNIRLGPKMHFQLVPMVYWLYADTSKGSYFSATGILSRKNLPFTLHSTINQTFRSDIPGNKNFMWNVMVSYNFSKHFKKV